MGEINVMDTIWYENPSKSEVIGSCGGDELSKAQQLAYYQGLKNDIRDMNEISYLSKEL